MASIVGTFDDNDTLLVLDDDATLEVDDELLLDDEVVKVAARESASLTTNDGSATNNDLVFTAKADGQAGNDITIEFNDPGVQNQAFSVVVTVHAIKVNLATGANPGHAVTTIASDVITGIENSGPASALITVANKAANNGTGLVSDMNATPLVGGGLTVDRAERGTFAAAHTGNDAFYIDDVRFSDTGVEVYTLGEEDDPDEAKMHAIATTTIVVDVGTDGDLPLAANVRNGHIYVKVDLDPGVKTLDYIYRDLSGATDNDTVNL